MANVACSNNGATACQKVIKTRCVTFRANACGPEVRSTLCDAQNWCRNALDRLKLPFWLIRRIVLVIIWRTGVYDIQPEFGSILTEAEFLHDWVRLSNRQFPVGTLLQKSPEFRLTVRGFGYQNNNSQSGCFGRSRLHSG